MIGSMKAFFTKAFQFRGRTNRRDYWIPNFVLLVVGVLLGNRKETEKGADIFSGLILLPSISLTSRRYQDAGISGWFQVPQYLSILLLPLLFMKFVKRWVKLLAIGIFIIVNLIGFVFTLLPSDGPNKYGRQSE